MLTINQFWNLIEQIDLFQQRQNNYDAALEPLRSELSNLSEKDIETFEDLLHEVLATLDGEDFFNSSGETSGDGFLYCRCYVVSQGEDYYKTVLEEPNNMPGKWFEPLLYVSSEAWARKMSKDSSQWTYLSDINFETGCNESRWSKNKIEKPALTQEQKAEQIEVEYQRAISSVVHAYRKGQYKYVVELLDPHKKRLSKKMLKLLYDATENLNKG